jgi:IS605 OrfB family transposase
MPRKRQKKIVALEPAPYRVPEATSYMVTLSAMTKGWTPEGKEYLKLVDPFSACVRTIVDRKLRGIPYSKPDLSHRYGLSSRLFNSAEVFGKGEEDSVRKTAQLALDKAKGKYSKALDRYVKGFLHGFEPGDEQRCISRIGKWRRRVEREEANVRQPRYFPGQDVYEQQHILEHERFQRLFHEVRASRIVSVGTWEEGPCCNSELQVQFEAHVLDGLVTAGYQFKLLHGGETLCHFKLSRDEGSHLCARLYQNQVPYEWGDAFRLPTKHELSKGKYDPNFIGPIPVAYQKKAFREYYVPLTVALLRDKKKPNRWQVRVSWSQKGMETYAVTDKFLSYDTNNDSLAYTLFRIEDGQLNILHKREVFFDPKPAKGKERERVLHGHLNQMFKLSQEHRACIVGEDLDSFEGAKVGFSAANAMLHDIPYAQIRDAVVRKGLKTGVPVRFIHPAFTSLLGGLFTDLNRDKAGALVTGLKGSVQGIELLESFCRKLLTQTLPEEGIRYKVEVKNQFSEIVKVVTSSQLTPTGVGDKRGPSFTYVLSQLVSDVTRHRKALHYRNRKAGKKLPTVVFLEDIWPTARPGWTAGQTTTAATAKVTSKAA